MLVCVESCGMHALGSYPRKLLEAQANVRFERISRAGVHQNVRLCPPFDSFHLIDWAWPNPESVEYTHQSGYPTPDRRLLRLQVRKHRRSNAAILGGAHA